MSQVQILSARPESLEFYSKDFLFSETLTFTDTPRHTTYALATKTKHGVVEHCGALHRHAE